MAGNGTLPTRNARVLPSAHGRYLGYPLVITERDVTVYTLDGREIATVPSISTARRIIRGYRKGSR